MFTSYRSGNQAQLFEVGFPDGPIRQLTEGAAIHPFSPAILPGGAEIVFVRGGSIWVLNRATLVERLVVDFEGGQLGECSFTADGQWLTAAIKLHGQL